MLAILVPKMKSDIMKMGIGEGCCGGKRNYSWFFSKNFNVVITNLARVGKMSSGIIWGISEWLIFIIFPVLFNFLRLKKNYIYFGT